MEQGERTERSANQVEAVAAGRIFDPAVPDSMAKGSSYLSLARLGADPKRSQGKGNAFANRAARGADQFKTATTKIGGNAVGVGYGGDYAEASKLGLASGSKTPELRPRLQASSRNRFSGGEVAAFSAAVRSEGKKTAMASPSRFLKVSRLRPACLSDLRCPGPAV